ncbi:DUF6164 family protein [Luteimonas sp. A478]
MAKLLLNLRHVPDDEADEVRAMLDANRIAWYETRPGLFGISLGAIWVKHDSDIQEAKRLMATYQTGRQAKMRAEHEAAMREGTAETFATMMRERPGWVLARVLGILLLLALMGLPAYLLSR